MRIDNADTLPYFVMQAGQRVPVRFTVLEPENEQRIADTWASAVYSEVWQHVVRYDITRQTTRKLVVADGSDERIFGLLRMGNIQPMRLIYRKLNTQSILETEPRLRYHRMERPCCGVGKVLVARLIAESIVRGYGGALVVSSRTQAIPFYRHLGFQSNRRERRLFSVEAETGTRLLQSVLL